MILEDEGIAGREMDLLPKINHPNIVKTLDTWEDAKNYYLIQELVEGQVSPTCFNLSVQRLDLNDAIGAETGLKEETVW